jgi:hypothetical protein
MRKSISLLAVGLSLLAFSAPQPVLAKSAKGGAYCASFSGQREVMSFHPWYQPYSATRCFGSFASCKAWLYKVQTAYPLFMDFRPCHKR